jgi:hypothetical protein
MKAAGTLLITIAILFLVQISIMASANGTDEIKDELVLIQIIGITQILLLSIAGWLFIKSANELENFKNNTSDYIDDLYNKINNANNPNT